MHLLVQFLIEFRCAVPHDESDFFRVFLCDLHNHLAIVVCQRIHLPSDSLIVRFQLRRLGGTSLSTITLLSPVVPHVRQGQLQYCRSG